MRKRINFCRTLFLLIIASAVIAGAQDEQWLQYHSAREISLIGFSSGTQSLEFVNEKPADMESPQFKSDEPVFAKWSSPMANGGSLWVALDRTNQNGSYDILYIDSNGNGRLDDETAVTSYRTTQNSSYFGPVKVVFQIEDGPVTYHLNFRFYDTEDKSRRRLYSYTGCWYEGDILVNGEKKHCVLFDYNVNGTFNDKSIEASESDRIRIGSASSQDTRFVGNFVEVDGTYFKPEIARDGAYIKLAEAKDIEFGKVRLQESVTELSAGGENGLFIVKPEDKIASLPVGKYRTVEWAAERKDDKGTSWKLQAAQSGKQTDFEITGAEETTLSIGEPIISRLSSSLREGTHYFQQSLQGRDGENITLTRNGARPQAPKLNIKNKDGTYDRTYSFSYG
ncbi:MAG: hypothetical protein JW715_10775 [Sedimentisphaerales bacterium]|nr:hypothetical protein [Sedimentisphaerales bacterium]